MSAATMNPPKANPFAGKATRAGGSYDIPPAGNHPAHLVAIYDLGTHDGEFEGKTKEVRKLYFAWELSGEMKPNGSPFVIGREYTVLVNDDGSFAFASKSKLREMLESWRGAKYQPEEDIDPLACLGRACLLNVAHKASGDKTYAEIASVSNLPKAMVAGMPRRHNDTVAYHISMGPPPEIDWLPWSYGQPLLDIVKESKEFTGKPIVGNGKGKDTPYSEAVPRATAPTQSAAAGDDDIPF